MVPLACNHPRIDVVGDVSSVADATVAEHAGRPSLTPAPLIPII